MNFSSALRVGAQVAGIGVVGGFGSGIGALESALKTVCACTPAGTIEAIEHPDGSACPCRVLRAETGGLERFMSKRALRRVDHYSRLALYAAHLALEDAGVDCAAPLGERVALVIASGNGAVGSTFSFLDTVIEGGDDQSSPTHFSNSVHNAAAAHVSMRLGITGPNLTVSQGDASVTSALAGALGYLADDVADAVLFGAVDEFSPVYGVGTDEVQGEGAAFFWLVRGGEGARYGEVALFRSDGGVRQGVAESFDLLFGEDAQDAENAAKVIDTAPLHGVFPTRSALDLAACAAGVGLAGNGGGSVGVIEREGSSCAVAWVHRG
jgi:3-oxoacyl-[acyl-carrier-protein] synthase II